MKTLIWLGVMYNKCRAYVLQNPKTRHRMWSCTHTTKNERQTTAFLQNKNGHCWSCVVIVHSFCWKV